VPESLSVTQVLDQAPDAGSRQAAIRLAKPGPWSDLGSAPPLLWGKCRGSAKDPYQVVVDLSGLTTKCTCPSRKFPCKHGLALMLLWAQDERPFQDAGAGSQSPGTQSPGTQSPGTQSPGTQSPGRESPGSRRRSLAPRGAPATEADVARKVPDPQARAKRAAERDATMTAALEDFELWLADLVRRGLAAARQEPYGYWDAAAGRLVDGQGRREPRARRW
jgi:hypothetical protein